MIDKRLLAMAVKTRREHSIPHFEIIHCPGKSDAEIEQTQTEAKLSHPLQEVHFIYIKTEAA
jgi:hypothetical protein